jgi:hypothetical protein
MAIQLGGHRSVGSQPDFEVIGKQKGRGMRGYRKMNSHSTLARKQRRVNR